MKLTQVLSQAHATAGYNRNKFLVFALLCTNCFTLVTLYGTVPRFSGTLDMTTPLTWICAAAAAGKARRGKRMGGGRGWRAWDGTGGTSALRLSNATDRTFKRGFGMQGFVYFSAYRLSASLFLSRFTCIAPIPFPMRACQGFVYFSAYRLSASLFVVIGLSPLPLHRNLDARVCRHSIDPFSLHTLSLPPSSPFLPQANPQPSAPYHSNITYYSSPIYGQFNSLRVLEWVVY
ncbi:unnamed protein product [Closterium sp. NIES-64]|nr:unnamed protein product [Closterium sp. NIES-64]